MVSDADFWYHGTNDYFQNWEEPPPQSKYKSALFPHQFISLSKDLVLARSAAQITHGLCRAQLLAAAKILDLRARTADAEMLWRRVLATEIGKLHSLIQTYDGFVSACRTGKVLRLHTTDAAIGAWMRRRMRLVNDLRAPLVRRQVAHLELRNSTRQWIEAVISPARQLGYQAVVCAEMDTQGGRRPKACLNLYVFDEAALTAPEWINVPAGIQ